MVVKSISNGHEIKWNPNIKEWIYIDTGEIANDIRPCAYCGEKPIGIKVKIPADLSHNGKEYLKYVQIDACIAPLVKALQEAGIDMRGSCCGHGKGIGDIHLQDGRTLLILDKKRADIFYKTRR